MFFGLIMSFLHAAESYRLKHRRPIRTQSLKEYVEKTIGRSTNEDDVMGGGVLLNFSHTRPKEKTIPHKNTIF
jgi:hypothetical protein